MDMVSTVDCLKQRLSQHDIRSNGKGFYKPKGFQSASVLIPLFYRDGELRVLLTVRAKHLRSHAGLVAFPGGHKDESDSSVIETALREAEEEIGLNPTDVDIIAILPPSYFRQPNKFISRVVGVIPESFVPKLNEDEVSKVFSLPLQRFLKNDFIKRSYMQIYLFYFKDEVNGETIITWGFTALCCIRLALALTDSDCTIEIEPGVYLNKFNVFDYDSVEKSISNKPKL